MDVRSIGFILLMALMGGVIAVLADRLGRKLGKSRHTLFGLRPRRTAELLTFVAGFLIPIVTIAFVISINSDYRQWILRGSQAIEDAKRYELQANERQQQVDDLEKSRVQAKTEFDAQSKELAALQKERAAIEKKRDELQSKLASLNDEVAKLNANARKLTAQTLKLTQQYLAAKTDYDGVKKSLTVQNSLYQDILERNRNIEKENAELERESTRLKQEASTLQGKITDLEKQRSDLQKQVEDAKIEYQKQLGNLNAQLAQAKKDLEQTQKELEDSQELATFLKGTFGTSRTQRITFYQMEEVARVTLTPNLNEDQARNQLNSLLRQSIATAEQRGAKPNDLPFAAMIMPTQQATTRDQIEAIIRRIRNLPDHMFLTATSKFNAFVGEPVALEVALFHNPVIYAEGATIADVRIDGSQSDAVIWDQLSNFFADTVRPAAQKAGMIPVSGPDGGLGTLTTGDVLQLIRRIKDVNAPVRVYAVAAKQTRAGDRLELTFRFR